MSRIPDRLLEHTVTLRGRRPIPSSTGQKYLPAVITRSITVAKTKTVIDQRDETRGQEVVSDTHVLVQPEFWVPPGSLMIVWPGTPQERTLEIVACAIGRHSIAWESAQFWGV